MSFFHYPQLTEILLQIYVLCYTQFGQTLRICGNCPQLGNWNPDKGYVLKTDKETYPQWKTDMPIRIRKNRGYMNINNNNPNNTNNNTSPQRLQFKLCIMTPTPHPSYRWQMSIPNRIIPIQCPMILQFRFDDQKMFIIHKKVTDIQCRVGTYNIIHDMQSSQTSSIQFKANYPVEYFYDGELGDSVVKRKYSNSQMSSNLVSQQEIVKFQQELYELGIEQDNTNYHNQNNINNASKSSQSSDFFSVMRFKTVQLLSSQSKKNQQHFHNNKLNNLHSSHHFQLDSSNFRNPNKISKSKSGDKVQKSQSIGTHHHVHKNNSRQKDLGIYIMKMPDLKENHVKFVSQIQKNSSNDQKEDNNIQEIQKIQIDKIKEYNQPSNYQENIIDALSISSDQQKQEKSNQVEFICKDNINHQGINNNQESVLIRL